MLATIGRALVQHWPALLALHLAGVLGRYVLIELSGWVGAYSAVLGLLILPLAVLARLAAFVGMFLVLRSSLRQLSAIAPPPESPEERRRAFVASLLGGVLPFFAVYMATGNVREDYNAYAARALEVQQVEIVEAVLGGSSFDGAGTVTDVLLGPASLIAIAIALAGRLAWGRWQGRLPRWLSVVAVYLEGVWVFLSVSLLEIVVGWVTDWVAGRQAMVWVTDVRAWLADSVAPLAWAWDGIDWLLGHAGGAIGLPLAWLTIAGVMYGQAVAAQAPSLSRHFAGARFEPVRARVQVARSGFRSLPSWAQVQLQRLWGSLVGRVTPIWRAVVLMVRGGPVLIGATVLLSAVLGWLEGALAWLTTRILGPHGFAEFWIVWDLLLLLPVTMIVETLRVAVTAGAYDGLIGRLRRQEADAAEEGSATSVTDASAREALTGSASGSVDEEVQQLGPVVEDLELDREGSGVGWDHEGHVQEDR